MWYIQEYNDTNTEAKTEIVIMSKSALLVRRVSFLFGIQQPTRIYQETTDSRSRVGKSRQIVYRKICAMPFGLISLLIFINGFEDEW
jgi:hypothetical protein